MAELRCTKKTVFQVDADAIDEFMSKEFAYELKLTDYECVAWEEYSNDSSYAHNVTPEPEFDAYTVNSYINKKKWPPLQELLDVACGRGLIEPGEYLVKVSW